MTDTDIDVPEIRARYSRVATGQDERLDPAGVANAFATLKSFGDGIRRPGAFGPAVEPPAGADEQTQFICYCGRPV